MSHSYEVEIKSLLGSKENAELLKKNLKVTFPNIKMVAGSKQLNHYFNSPQDFSKLISNLKPHIPGDKQHLFEETLKIGKKVSIRTRDADGKVLLVIKASVGDDTSSNGVKRIEFESKVSLSLSQLDNLLLDSDCTYQAKWSREREELEDGDLHVCIDKNAGYGYLAEFEKVTTDESSLDKIKNELNNIMDELGVHELKQDRLERMFDYYNKNWRDYYGTDKTFIIE